MTPFLVFATMSPVYAYTSVFLILRWPRRSVARIALSQIKFVGQSQIDDAELSGVRLTNPEVRIKPAMIGNTWYLSVGKYNTQAQVKRVK